MSEEITHDPARRRFELVIDGQVAYEEYARDGDVVDFRHTVVPESLGGRGVGSRLARHVLDWAAAEGLRVRPSCSFIRAWIDRHPEYQANSLAHGARR